MNRSLSVLTAIVVLSSASLPAFGQAAPATGTTATGGAAASKPLSAAERKFIKDAGEQILVVTHLTELTRHQGPGSEPVKKLNAKILEDFGKIWGELGTVAGARKVDLPKTEVTSSEKGALSKLRDAGKSDAEKFDKPFLKTLDKEMKKTMQVFQNAEKSVQDPELKTVVNNWIPKVRGYADDVSAAETEATKRK